MNRVINAAAQGIITTAHHPHWGDVNPIRRQSLTPDERAHKRHIENMRERESIKRQREIKRRFPNSKILYV